MVNRSSLMQQAVAHFVRRHAQVIEGIRVQILQNRHTAQRGANRQRILPVSRHAQQNFRL
ncbi:MAG TPA: hypothetical protein DHV94_10980 [Clostridiales bacterium]|nr:hypothetical protein [Clostridiales bacterium]